MNVFEDFFSRYFNNQGNGNIPNPFDNEAFAEFISEQIKNAIPNFQQNNNNSQNRGNLGFTNPNSFWPYQTKGAQNSSGQSQSQSQSFNKEIKYNIFETHDKVIVRIAVSQMNSDEKKSIFLNSHELLLKEEGRQSPILHLALPKPVISKKPSINMQNSILEIQLVKKSLEPLNEFEITELLKDESKR